MKIADDGECRNKQQIDRQASGDIAVYQQDRLLYLCDLLAEFFSAGLDFQLEEVTNKTLSRTRG